jgi:opacity protein-like surface antigen
MMQRHWFPQLSLVLALALLTPVLAEAQIVRVSRNEPRNAIGFNIGYFVLRGEDSRTADDVLLADLNDLAFRIKDFNNVTFGGEWLFGLGDYLEGGLGLGFYQETVPSVYRDLQDIDGTEIAQELKLRIVPMTATLRFLPIGRGSVAQPYLGAGIGIFNWRYSEVGEFVAPDGSLFRNRYVADGNTVGPVVLAGIRAPVGDNWMVGGEIRWQRAEGDTDRIRTELLGEKIDLGGWTTNFTVHLRF